MKRSNLETFPRSPNKVNIIQLNFNFSYLSILCNTKDFLKFRDTLKSSKRHKISFLLIFSQDEDCRKISKKMLFFVNNILHFYERMDVQNE